MNQQVDMGAFIAPKSDQLNSDDLISGPISVTITAVSANEGSPEQPISVSFKGDEGKPFKPCKSMRRVMVHVWGADASKYVGRSMTLYRDPKVQFGGMQVGGIRVSHMSHISEKMTMALTASRAKRAPFTVLPLAEQTPAATTDHSAALEELKALAVPGNKDALGAKWQEIGAAARKALAAELPALKAACDAPPAEDVPFDAETGEIIEPEQAAEPATYTLGDQLGLDEPAKVKADAIIAELENAIVAGAVDDVMALHKDHIDAMDEAISAPIFLAASKRRDGIEAAKAKAKGVDA